MGERQFGPYRLVQQIAVGGMAEIHLAKTHGIAGFEKYVALKMIHPNFSQDDQFIQMLIDEAKITVQLQHVNIAQTFDLGRVGNTYYITMEYVDGADLYKLLRKASERDIPTPVDVAAYIAKEMATGLDYAHRKRDVSGRPLRIVHRDVSPQNVLISHAGEVKLVDFGIAKATMRVRQTAVGVIKGKYYYMSPEQAWGDPLDHRSDIFSTGIVLYEALTGQMLYLEEDLHRLLDMVRKANIAPPTTLRRDIPPQLERIVMNALAKRPEDRYQTAGDLSTDLERFLHVYSPVFTAAKVTNYFDTVLGEPQPAPEPSIPVPEARNPAHATKNLTRDQLVRARSEFTDENSVIFRVEDIARRREPSSFNEDTGLTNPQPLRGMVSGGGNRAPDVHTMEIPDDDGEEKTVISGPPGFGGGISSPQSMPTELSDDSYDQTVIDSDFDESPTRAQLPHEIATAPPDDEGPTRLDFDPGKRRPGQPPENRAPQAARGRIPLAPAHPALSASTQRPAVSALRKPRGSRRTPPTGVPTVPQPQQGSLLKAIVGAAAQESGPTQPYRGGDAVPRVEMSTDSRVAVNRPGSPSPPIPQQNRVPGPPFGSAQDRPPAQPPPTPPGMQSAGPPPQQPAPQGFPLAAPVKTPNPFERIVSQPVTASPFPSAQPSTISRQLAALQIDEIPDQYKVGRGKLTRWLVGGAVALLSVTVGVLMYMVLSSTSGSASARLRINSIPQGASVSINGTPLAQKTPILWEDAEPDKRYQLELSLDGYETERKEVVMGPGGETPVLVYLDRIRVRLVVTSKPRADVFINDIRMGTTPFDRKFEDPPKTLELRLKGHKPERLTLDWDGKTEKVVDVQLKRK